MQIIKPVIVGVHEGVTIFERRAVLAAIREMVRRASMGRHVRVVLAPDAPIEKYVEKARRESERSRQFSAFALLKNVHDEPWMPRLHYDVVVVRDDVYAGSCHFVVGLSVRGVGSVISVARFRELASPQREECIKTVAMHEIGHVFGLISRRRRAAVDVRLGRHCANRCIMRQGLRVPDDWIAMTNDRLHGDALCARCVCDLREFFEN